MRAFRSNWLVRAVPLAAAALLAGCDAIVLDPKGPVGSAEKTLLIDSLAIMLAIVIPTRPTANAPAMPTTNGFSPTPLNTAKLVFNPTAAIAMPNRICDAQ